MVVVEDLVGTSADQSPFHGDAVVISVVGVVVVLCSVDELKLTNLRSPTDTLFIRGRRRTV